MIERMKAVEDIKIGSEFKLIIVIQIYYYIIMCNINLLELYWNYMLMDRI